MDKRKKRELVNLVNVISRTFLVDPLNPSRKREYIMPRQVLCKIFYEELSLSYDGVGQVFGGLNHATVLNARNRATQAMDLKDGTSLQMQRYYNDFLRVVKRYLESKEAKEEDYHDIFESVIELQERVKENDKRLEEAMKTVIRVAEEKDEYKKKLREYQKQNEELERNYLEIKAKYDSFQPSYSEEKEVLRMKGFIA